MTEVNDDLAELAASSSDSDAGREVYAEVSEAFAGVLRTVAEASRPAAHEVDSEPLYFNELPERRLRQLRLQAGMTQAGVA